MKNFNRPYISHKPYIKIIDLNKEDKYIFMANDVLQNDEIDNNEMNKLILGE